MSAVLRETASERAESLRDALKADPSFIGEAIAEGDRTELVDAFLAGNLPATHKAIGALVAEWLESEEDRCDGQVRRFNDHPTPDAAIAYLCELHGVIS